MPTPVSFDDYVTGFDDTVFATTLLRENTNIGGRRAVRFETVSTGEGLYPQGTRTYGYVVDRDGSAFATFTKATPGQPRYARYKIVVDRAVRTLRFR